MSAPSSRPNSPACCGCLHFPLFAKARRSENIPLPRKKSSPAPQIHSTLSPQTPSVISEITSTNHKNGEAYGGEAGNVGHPVISQEPAIIPGVPSTICGKDAKSGKAGDSDNDSSVVLQDSQLPATIPVAPSMIHANENVQSEEVGDSDGSIISYVPAVMHCSPAAPFMNHGNDDVESKETGDNDDAAISQRSQVPTVIPSVTTAPAANRGNEDTQRREAEESDDDSVVSCESQLPAIISAAPSTICRNEDTQNKKARDGSVPVILPQTLLSQVPPIISKPPSTNSENQDVQNKGARDKGGSVMSPRILPSQVSPIISKPPSTNSGNQDPQHKKNKDEGEFVPPTQTRAPTVAAKRSSPSIKLFQEASNFQINNANITAIGGDATIIRFGNEPFTEPQRTLIGDYIATFNALTGLSENVMKHILTHLITNLPRAEAIYSDYQTKKKSGPCFKGTRVALLREMADWVTGSDKVKMYILSGLAGIGKTTVAYTIASRAADLNLLGASFFFSRDEPDRNNAKKLFTTVAYQLCVYNERFSKAIGDVLLTESGSAATTKDPLEQLHVLILNPIRSIVQSHTRPILIVIDALDECCKDDIRSVFTGLSQLVLELPAFKVILTTRPQPDINYFFYNKDGHKYFHLHDIEDKIVDNDIRLYLEYYLSLEKVREDFPRRQWCASDVEIDALVHAAGRLFIIASTAVRYILDKSASNPAARMRKLLDACARDHMPFKNLGHFYTIILREVVPEDCDDEDIISRYQSVLGTIIVIQRPLSVPTLSYLIGTDEEEIYAVLDNLQPVILLGDGDIPRIYHISFPDYLTDEERCKDLHLLIDPKIHHTQITSCCFKMTDRYLKYNILGLGTPARFMTNEDGLKKDGVTDKQLLEKIPQQLRYASIYWFAHLAAANIETSDIMNELEKFVNEHALHWFEVLSLIGNLDVAPRAIRVVLKNLKSTPSDLHQLLTDALRFVSKFYEIINQSALHTYHSALPFTPTESLLYRRYIREAEHGICDVEGGPQKWNAIVAHLGHGKDIDGVKFSLNSDMIVSFSEHCVASDGRILKQGKLNIWDAFTGTPISTIPVREFAISNDFATVISSEDNVITYYNLDGSPSGTILTTLSKIEKLALSSESDRIAALLSDGSICLWKSTNGELIGNFGGDKGKGRHRLEFSCSGTRLVHSSPNGFVKLLDGISGGFIADLQCGSNNLLEFTVDSSRIASLSKDSGLTLWNSETGGLIAVAKVVWREYSMNLAISINRSLLAISKNGSLLATSNVMDVTLWIENCGQLTKIGVLQCSVYIWSIAFSPDNMLAICDLSNIQIHNIETHTMSTLASAGPSIGSATFSPDGTRFACGTLLYDVHAIDTSSSPSRKTLAVALSRDCSRLACGFDDGTVELWGTSPAMQPIASHRYRDGWIRDVVFGPDSRLFASASYGGTIRLWDYGDGSLHGAIDHGSELQTLALSNSVLIVGGEEGNLTLWDLGMLSLLHTFEISGQTACAASISDGGDLATFACDDNSINLVDLTNRTITDIATLDRDYTIRSLAFLPDKSHLVVQSYRGEFQSVNLINKSIENEDLLEQLVQLPSTPLWHGVPVSVYQLNNRQTVLRSTSENPAPLLWVPTDHVVGSWALGSSMIALSCPDGGIILLRLRTCQVGRS